MEIGIILALIIIILSCTFHEAAHAYTAHLLGDPTAKELGRVSLNPFKHIDPFMTIILPAIMFISSQGRFIFGGPKPVPINPYNFRNYYLGMMLTALAGPMANLLLACCGFALIALCFYLAPEFIKDNTASQFFLFNLIFLNLILALFNMLPIPPLDGSRVLRFFFPQEIRNIFDALDPFGLIIVFVVIFAVPGFLSRISLMAVKIINAFLGLLV